MPARSEARERLLATASGLFYGEGIRAVGVDRLVSEAQVTRATFYRHFPSKEDLVVAYLRAADEQVRAQVRTATESASTAADALRAVAASIADDLSRSEFRGCAFLRAAAEFPDPADPVHREVVAHRACFVGALRDLFAEVYRGEGPGARPERAARHFLMLRDGAMSAASIDASGDTDDTFRRGVEGLITVVHAPGARPQLPT
ncbi:TetR/AcrR family transcriptional regulator [Actinomycetospora termitidis]|uniref:TetR/AcrR family transcriptional regulator n=1 Tax=Actinomycetospora termitidis TaxID=3053470 RepID=A0ABT7MHJ7_9PSEU|nr:TetR/AcrR family transcriptional regulator [Actinomycetospora sp. Odt1-22]MDL5160163.1 TetR/AcrR family transcriptional regulator [Actinomycetospora sp. Odt1-22]